jgi:hypothetical protein
MFTSMSIPRKELRFQQQEPLEPELLAAFPRPPPEPRSPARLSLQSPGLTPRPSDHSFIPTGTVNDDTDNDSLYAEPGPPLPPYTEPPSGPSAPPKHNSELQIVLDHPSKVYAPGETIIGYIIGWSTAEEHLHIILWGQVTTAFQEPKATYKNRTPLVLQVNYLEFDSESYMQRFELSIPYVCDAPLWGLNDFTQILELQKNYWTTIWPVQDPFENDAGHPLPPSIYTGPRSTSKLSNVLGIASITYALIAVRSIQDQSTNTLITNAHFQLPVTLTTRRLPIPKVRSLKDEKHHMTFDLSIQTAALAKERKLRLREQFYDAFNTSAPTFYFSVKANAPRLSVPGATMKISAMIEVLPPPPGKLYNFPIPDITITSMKFLVRSYTGMRTLVATSMQPSPAMDALGVPRRRETFKENEFRQAQTPANATFTPQEGKFEDQVCVSTITLPKEMVPSFKTYSTWRGYCLEYTIKLRVAGKKVEAKFANDLDIVAGGDACLDCARVLVDNGMSRQIAEAIVRARMTK